MLFLRVVFFGFCLQFFVYGNEQTDLAQYAELEEDCHRVVYNIHRNLPILEWPDSLTREILEIYVEEYLIELNTPEARKLRAEYEGVNWNIGKMVELHYRSRKDQRTPKNQ